LDEIFHLRLIESQTSLLIVILENFNWLSTLGEDVDNLERNTMALSEHALHIWRGTADVLSHAIIEHVLEGGIRSLKRLCKLKENSAPSLNAFEILQTANSSDAGGLGAPWRDVSGSDVVDLGIWGGNIQGLAEEVLLRPWEQLPQLCIGFL
jgi:hypothetical protein